MVVCPCVLILFIEKLKESLATRRTIGFNDFDCSGYKLCTQFLHGVTV